mgnify:CR=1 FL=1
MMNNIFSYTFRTSMGIHNYFFQKEDKTLKIYEYLPFEKISDNEFIVKPDLNKEPVFMSLKINFKELKPYNESKKYINVFQNTSEENNVMNYDKYGFPIFDDEWEDDKAFQKTIPVEEFMKEHPGAKTIAEHWEKEEINIKKEDKEEIPKDKFSLF